MVCALGTRHSRYFVNVTIDDGSFWGFVYPGDLATGAFGWNSARVGFTLNYVAPYAVDEHGRCQHQHCRAAALRGRDPSWAAAGLAIACSAYDMAPASAIGCT